MQLAGNCLTPAQPLTLVEAMIADEQLRLTETIGSRLQLRRAGPARAESATGLRAFGAQR